ALVEIEHRLPRARIEAHLIGLGKQALPVAHETQLGERRLEALVERVHRGERLTDLPDRGAGVEQRPCRSERQQVTERIAGVAVEEAETLQLRRPSRCQRQDAHDLAEPVDSLARSVHQFRKCRRPATPIGTVFSSRSTSSGVWARRPPRTLRYSIVPGPAVPRSDATWKTRHRFLVRRNSSSASSANAGANRISTKMPASARTTSVSRIRLTPM